MLVSLFLAASLATAAPASSRLSPRQAAPFQQSTTTAWDLGATTEFPIHPSCNTTQRAQIAAGLNETILLASHARNHILRWGTSSSLYQRYFGNLPPYEVIGAFELIVSGDRANLLFRCDDPDGNCRQPGKFTERQRLTTLTSVDWHGHWRGSNATSETVICDLSNVNRRWLNSMRGRGYTVAASKPNTFWASDLMHRLFHVPAIGHGYVEHYIETYQDALVSTLQKTVPRATPTTATSFNTLLSMHMLTTLRTPLLAAQATRD